MSDGERAKGAATSSMLVSIVNYRTGALVVDCLASLETEVAGMPGLRIIVIDNASGDDSCARIEAAIASNGWSGWAKLVRAPRNGGFAYGNNLAIEEAARGLEAPELTWLLNPDTRVVPGAAAALASFMQCHPKAGIAGSGLLTAEGIPWPYAFRFPTILAEMERGLRLGIATRLLRNHQLLRRMEDVTAPVDPTTMRTVRGSRAGGGVDRGRVVIGAGAVRARGDVRLPIRYRHRWRRGAHGS